MEYEEKRHPEYQYLDLLSEIMEKGYEKVDYASGMRFKSVFGRQMRFDLSEDFPLITTKKMFMKGVIHELLWFLRGETNIKYLVDNNVHIWDEWAYRAYKNAIRRNGVPSLTKDEFAQKIREASADSDFVQRWGELGPVYGRQWRKWKASNGKLIDQLQWAVWKTKNYPDRKHVCITAWNPENIYEMSEPGATMEIPPCHVLYNINVANNKLSLALYQRSCDMFLGIPFNIASYALLTRIFSHVCGYQPGEFIHFLGDAHIYGNHYEQVKEQLTREPLHFPQIHINPQKKSIDDFVYEDFELRNYSSHPPLKGEITVVGGFDEKERGIFEKKNTEP